MGYKYGDCRSLSSMVIPDSVTSIGDYAFFGGVQITDLHLHTKQCDKHWQLFEDYSSLSNMVIPDSVTSIGFSAFYGCWDLNPQIKNDIIKRFGTNVF